MIVKLQINFKNLVAPYFLFLGFIGLSACDNQEQPIEGKNIQQAIAVTPDKPTQVQELTNQSFIIENKSYLFNIAEHSTSELQALLERAEEVTATQSPEYQDLEIVMVIHGPDIELFTQQSYAENQNLIDLAAKLDAYEIVDMKVCEATMKNRGVDREDIPKFIDSVPFAPIEIQNRLNDGYINL